MGTHLFQGVGLDWPSVQSHWTGASYSPVLLKCSEKEFEELRFPKHGAVSIGRASTAETELLIRNNVGIYVFSLHRYDFGFVRIEEVWKCHFFVKHGLRSLGEFSVCSLMSGTLSLSFLLLSDEPSEWWALSHWALCQNFFTTLRYTDVSFTVFFKASQAIFKITFRQDWHSFLYTRGANSLAQKFHIWGAHTSSFAARTALLGGMA